MNNLTPLGGRLVRAALLRSERNRRTFRELELDWPDSRGMLARFAVLLHAQVSPEGMELLRACIASGLSAYRKARREGANDRARFAAFVHGVTQACTDPAHHALVARAMSPLQRRVIADRVEAGELDERR